MLFVKRGAVTNPDIDNSDDGRSGLSTPDAAKSAGLYAQGGVADAKDTPVKPQVSPKMSRCKLSGPGASESPYLLFFVV